MSILEDAEKGMKHAIEHFKTELKNIRTGHANPAMLDGVTVEVYGTQMRLRDLATVTSPELRQLLVSPYDANNAGAINKAIEKANLGIQPVLDANIVRITIPPMDEALRKEMVKLCHKKREECKVSIRNTRRECNEVVRKQKNEGDLAEDLMKKLEKDIQELTDKFCKEADETATSKEKEILTI